jgi:hypothetical protein
MKQTMAYTASEDGRVIIPLTATTLVALVGLAIVVFSATMLAWLGWAILGELGAALAMLSIGIGVMYAGIRWAASQ